MNLAFTKMHGLGNDFMVIDGVTQDVDLNAEQIQLWSDRNFGIGFDQLLLVEPPKNPDVDFGYRIFNADGSEVEHCGNGARCFARFVREKGLTHKDLIKVSIMKGQIELRIHSDNTVTVDMGAPILEPYQVPFLSDTQQVTYKVPLEGGDETVELSAISMGNPHGVLVVKDTETAPVNTLGPLLEGHPSFPERANIGFLQIISRTEGKLRVFERGVGETLACGTGACAAMVAGRLNGMFDDCVKLHLSGGTLEISWSGEGHVMMTGPTSVVFDGQINIESEDRQAENSNNG